MASIEFTNLVKELSLLITHSQESFQPSERNEEWTKAAIIVPLIEGLGWDKAKDIGYESSPDDVEGRLDLIIKCQHLIGIETKALDVGAPKDNNHPHIKKGLKQAKDRDASYFIWTNGDCWQFYSLVLQNAPVYQVIISSTSGSAEQLDAIANNFRIIEKKAFISNPESFDETIRENWKRMALSDAWEVLIEKHTNNLIQLIRKDLPTGLDIKDEEIRDLLGTLKLSKDVVKSHIPRTKKVAKSRSFPDDWKQLLESYEPIYDRARKRFCSGNHLKLGAYILSAKYKPWSKSITWRHVGVPNDTNERKKLGPVVSLFLEWRFIEEVKDTTEMYKRVEESIPYLKQLIEK